MKVLIVDDERAIRYSLKEILEMENYQVELAENGLEGLQKAQKEKYDAIFCDIKMPEMDGIELLGKIIEEGIESPVVMVSGHADINIAVECIKKGAFDFIEKPLDLNRILITLKNATDKATLVKETKILKKKIYGNEMIGESISIAHLKEMIGKVAPTQASVLITGPNGSGKARKAPSHRPSGTTRANLSRPMAAPSSWTRLETCRSRPRPRCCACCRRKSSPPWAETRKLPWTCA